MKRLFLAFLFLPALLPAFAQPYDTLAMQQRMKADVYYLSSKELMGREAGTPYEIKARDYIAHSFESTGTMKFLADSSYFQGFHYSFGKTFEEKSIRIGKKVYEIDYLYIPGEITTNILKISFPFLRMSEAEIADTRPSAIVVTPEDLKEKTIISVLRRAGDMLNPDGFRVLIYADASEGGKWDDLTGYARNFGKNVIFVQLRGKAAKKLLTQKSPAIDISTRFINRTETAFNVVAFINNGAPTTVVLGAHYDHLGMGAVNSRHEGFPDIHYGADDNASGTAAVMEMARHLNSRKNLKHNYIFVAFSAEEKGLIGSTYFMDNYNHDARIISMLNFDMVGRVDTTTFLLNLNGAGSSPAWDTLLPNANTGQLALKLNKGGLSGSDHMPFYLAGIPVLFFFTGLHSDYHTPADTPEKVNYHGMTQVVRYALDVVNRLEQLDSLPYSKAEVREPGRSPARQGVTLGVIPDHAFDGKGMRLSGVLDGRTAEKAGFLKNDIIIRIAGHEVTSIESYMAAMSKLKPGNKAEFVILRDGKEMTIQVGF